ncbi:ISAs1 family transposase [Alkalimarinus alittae]|uniref:ISAs1 family transposase n=1 Tax=Alkalimarinus alittae TaxID=2961619 RepID=A0ABY6MZ62_9ALTE|nr:ISAs1 family transposase [Alkalimarinus alittae]
MPCAETLRFFIACIKPNELIKGFEAFVNPLNSAAEGDVIAIDGKTMRGTRHGVFDALHVVSAWSKNQGITLAALESKGKSNEIKTVPELLELIDVKGATITTDAMGCQRAIVAKIRDGQDDYVLQLKNNQENLLKEIKAYHHKLEREGYANTKYEQFEEIDKGHGRLEIRGYQHFELSDWVSCKDAWSGAQSVVRVERSRSTAKGESTEVAWYLKVH